MVMSIEPWMLTAVPDAADGAVGAVSLAALALVYKVIRLGAAERSSDRALREKEAEARLHDALARLDANRAMDRAIETLNAMNERLVGTIGSSSK